MGLGVCQGWGEKDAALYNNESGLFVTSDRVHTVTPVYKVNINMHSDIEGSTYHAEHKQHFPKPRQSY